MKRKVLVGMCSWMSDKEKRAPNPNHYCVTFQSVALLLAGVLATCNSRPSKIIHVVLLVASHLPRWIQFMIVLRSEPRRRLAVAVSRDEIVVTMFCKEIPIGPRYSVLA